MTTTKYLLIGGGIAADAAIEGIRELDKDGSITLVANEPHAPYNRPPLTKALWKGEPESVLDRPTNRDGVDLRLGRTIDRLDVTARTAVDSKGERYTFDRVLLATGGRPRRLPFGGDEILYFRTRDDYARLREVAKTGQTVAVLGGGFIGCELAAALAMNGVTVRQLVPEAGLGARVFPQEMSAALVGFYESKGVKVHTGTMVKGLERQGAKRVLLLANGGRLEVDHVVAGIGIEPNVDLARAAGLSIDDGIVVDDRLSTSNPIAFAAGDVAHFPAAWGSPARVEHEDAALSQGRHAGRNLAGANEPYHHLPMFYSDLFDLGYEAVGRIDSRLETVADWKQPHREGVVYYLDGDRLRGVLLVNVWGKVDEARALLSEDVARTKESLRGLIS